MAPRQKVESDKDNTNGGSKGNQPVPFDDALRRLVNTPPKPVKKPDKGKRPAKSK